MSTQPTTTPPPTITAQIVQRLRNAVDALEASPMPIESGHAGIVSIQVHDVHDIDTPASALGVEVDESSTGRTRWITLNLAPAAWAQPVVELTAFAAGGAEAVSA